jgi:hypothetical protein
MIVTTSNILSGVTPIIVFGVNGDIEQVPANITDRDFSVSYTSIDQFTLVASFGATTDINYIALAGINLGDSGGGVVIIQDNQGNNYASQTIETNQCIVLTFPTQSFNNLTVQITNNQGSNAPQLTYIAAGLTLTIPNGGEISGYNRQFLTRNIKQRTTMNNIGAPIAAIQKRIALNGVLKLPNMTKSFSENEWQTFLNFAYSDHFFILEQSDNPFSESADPNPSSYLCYETVNSKATAHAQTRALNNLSISYKVFTGL